MRTKWTTQAGFCVFALFLFSAACGDRGSGESTPPPKANPQSGSPCISTIQAPASVRDRVRTDVNAPHMVPDVVTAPGEVALDLNQVAKIMSRIEGQAEMIHVQFGVTGLRFNVMTSVFDQSALRHDPIGYEFLRPSVQILGHVDLRFGRVCCWFATSNRIRREYVEVQLTIESPATLAVPLSALTMVDNVRGVFVQREPGYAFVPIKAGREGGGWVEVQRGLTAGELVVVDGVFDLKNVLLKEHIESGERG